MSAGRPVLLTGVGVAIPGVDSALDLLDAETGPVAAAPVAFEAMLGKRGLRYKDQATRLALCAAANALQDAGLPSYPGDQPSADSFGVVASSNLSNLDTVCRVVSAIHDEGVECTSPMELPNASSNVVASSVAIWFGLRGLNLMICNGATSGVDALHAAATAIRAGRADRVVIVGVETANDIVARLMRESAARRVPSDGAGRLLEGAAAVVFEAGSDAGKQPSEPEVRICGYAYDRTLTGSITASGGSVEPALWLTPNRGHRSVAEQTDAAAAEWPGSVRRSDLSAAFGECYGALGVLQCAAAGAWLRSQPGGQVLITSGGCYGDGYASMHLRAGPGR